MTKTICKKVYAQERSGEPFIIEVEVTEDNWDFQKSCYQQYELNAWGKKINGEKKLILSKSANQPFSLESNPVNDFIKGIEQIANKKHYKILTEREYELVRKAYYYD